MKFREGGSGHDNGFLFWGARSSTAAEGNDGGGYIFHVELVGNMGLICNSVQIRFRSDGILTLHECKLVM